MAKRKMEAPPSVSEASVDSNSVEMRIPARAEWVRVVRLATAGVAARLGFSYDDIEDLKLAVAEACNNAIMHGGDSSGSESAGASTPLVTVKWTVSPDRLRISVSDQGRLDADGLPIAAEADKSTQADIDDVSADLPEGGMGLLLIQTLMDEVEQEAGPHADTTLHMVKYAPRIEPGSKAATSAASSTPDTATSKNRDALKNRHAVRPPASTKVKP